MTTTTLTAREDLKRGDRLQIRRTTYGAVFTSQVYTLQSHNEYFMEVEELTKSIRIDPDHYVEDDHVLEFLLITELPTTYGSVIILEEAKSIIGEDVLRGSKAIFTRDSDWITTDNYGDVASVHSTHITKWRVYPPKPEPASDYRATCQELADSDDD